MLVYLNVSPIRLYVHMLSFTILICLVSHMFSSRVHIDSKAAKDIPNMLSDMTTMVPSYDQNL